MAARRLEREMARDGYRRHVAWLREEYAAALEAAGFDAVVLHSGSLRLRSEFDDVYAPLRVVPHFAHWLPLEWPDCALAVSPRSRPRLWAFRDRSFWERVPEPDWAHFSDEIEIAEIDVPVRNRSDLVNDPALGSRVALVAEDPRCAAAWSVPADRVNPPELMRRLDELRVTKTPYEVACIAEANRRAILGHRAVEEAFRAGEVSELELHLRFLGATRQDDQETPYKNIVAQGSNAAILHHVHYGRTAVRGPRSLLVDAAASCHGYAADVTRTYVEPGSDGAASLFGDLVRALDQAQRELCARVRVGLPYEELHDESHLWVAGILREAGISRLSAGELVASGITRTFLPHGLGHSLGLQTHDVGCLVAPPRPENPWLRNTRPIAPHQVFTIEPGIYFIDTLLAKLEASPAGAGVNWRVVNALRPFGGIRIEDDLVVLEPSPGQPTARNFTREAFE